MGIATSENVSGLQLSGVRVGDCSCWSAVCGIEMLGGDPEWNSLNLRLTDCSPPVSLLW